MPVFQPTNLSGLFAWYMASSITGVSNGGAFNNWADLSGSGNNLTSNTSFGSTPTFQTNVLNGFPVVRFSGGYFECTTHNQSVEVSPSSLCIYTVYRTFDPYTQQVLFADDHKITTNQNQDFVLGLNFNGDPSGWYYSFGHKTNAGGAFTVVEAISPTFGKAFQPGTQFVLRADVFAANGFTTPSVVHATGNAGFYFGRYGANIGASSICNNTVDPLSTLKIGFANTTTPVFNGDVAEICAFSSNGPTLLNQSIPSGLYYGESSAHQVMIDYLTQKYSIGAITSCPLFLFADTPSGMYTSRSLYELGGFPPPSSVTHSCNLYVGSTTKASGLMTLYTESTSKASGIIRLYIGSTTKVSGLFPLYIGSTTKVSGLFPLYIGSTTKTSGLFPLYTESTTKASGLSTLYTRATTQISGFRPLYIGSTTKGSGLFSLYTESTTKVSGLFTLYVPVTTRVSGLFTLYTESTTKASGLFPLYIKPKIITSGTYYPTLYEDGKSSINFSTTLNTRNIGTGTMVSPLYVSGSPHSATSSFDLFIRVQGAVSGTIPLYTKSWPNSGIPLFLHGKSSITANPDLYVHGLLSSSGHTTLFVENIPGPPTADMVLYTNSIPNPIINNKITSFISGPTSPGTSGSYKNTTLFLNAGSNKANLPLYLKGFPPPLPTGVLPLFIGTPIHTGVMVGTTNLYILNSNQLILQGIKMYTNAPGGLNGGLMYQESMNLFLNRPQANIVSMFMWGRGIDIKGAPMVISGVLGNTKNLSLYVGSFGPPASSTLSLFVKPSLGVSKGFTMSISGKPYIQDLMTMYERGF